VTTEAAGVTSVAPAPRPPNRVVAVWVGDETFDTSKPNGPIARVDGHGKSGQGPVDTLLSALATCSAIDVVHIMEKRRTPVASLEIETIGTRAEVSPRRLVHVLMKYKITGDGIDRANALRAIELSITKYCSVRESLDPTIPVEWELELNGQS
jgi:putative redox protein